MPRPERALGDLSGPVAQFAADLRELRRRAGSPSYRRLARTANYASATLAEAASGHRLPTLAVTLAYVRACAGDVDQWEERWLTIARELDLDTTRPSGSAEPATALQATSSRPSLDDVPCPYPGLAAFATSEAEWFFGRERLTAELVERLAEGLRGTGPLLVVGPSGAGKSSLLRAGLVPALARGSLPVPGAQSWPVLLFTPTAHPVHELAARLSELTGTDPETLANRVTADPHQLTDVLRDVSDHARGTIETTDARVVLVVDQFEEIFALCADKAEREVFVSALCTAARAGAGEGRVDAPMALVVLGMRADFYGHCAAFPELVGALQASQVIVGPLTVSELRAVIIEPADAIGLRLQPGLVEVLLRDLGTDPDPQRRSDVARYDAGALPLLSHALRSTWQQREGHTLTLNGYHLTGGISGAVATTAERMYVRMDNAAQRLARLVLMRLVQVGDGADDTRRRVDRAELLREFSDPATVTGVLEAFARARLATLDADTVEITHDALLRHWPRLKEWIDTDRAGLLIHQHLIEAAHTWERESKDAFALYRGTRLATARDWVEGGHHDELAPLVAEFLDTSIRHEHTEQRTARRRTRRLYQLLTTVTVLFVIAAGLAGYALRQRAVAYDQRQSAVSRQVAIEADRMRGIDVSLAMQLSLAAYQISPTNEARSGLLDSSAMIPATRILGPLGVVQSVALSPDQRTLAAGSSDHAVRLWDVTTPGQPHALATLTGSTSDVYSVAFSPDGHTLAAAGGEKTVRLWDVTRPSHPVLLGQPLTGPSNTVYSVAFSPDGHTLAAGSADHTVRLWDVSQPTAPHMIATLAGPAGYVYSVAFSPDRRTLAAGSADKTVRLWDVTAPSDPIPLGPPLTGPAQTVFAVAFSPDGRTLAVGSADRSVRLWNVAHPARAVRLGRPLTGPTSFVYSVAFSPDGNSLAVGSADGSVRLWNLAADRVTALLHHPGPVTSVAFGHDSHTLATGSADGQARLWTLPGPVLTGPARGVTTVAFSPDGRILAAGSIDAKVWLWDVANPAQPQPLPSLTGPAGTAYSVAFSPDGRTLAAGSIDKTVRLWNVSHPARPIPLGRPLTGPAGPVESVAFSPNGRILAAGSDDAKVWLWDVANPAQPQPLPSLTGPANYVYSVAFSPNGRILAAGSVDKTARLWNITRPAQPTPLGRPLTGPTNYVESVAFSPEGNTLAVGSADHTVRLWNLASPARPTPLGQPLTGPNSTVYTVVFSPDGHTLATGNLDDTIWLWDVTNTLQPHARVILTGPTDVVYGVAFSPDGHTLAVGSADNTVRLWRTDPSHVASYICSIAGDPLTRTEWNQYIPGLPYNPPCPQRR
ncbi:MAG TPA: AAA family ATPase [Streptosporangiaceae bacterium]